MIILTDVDDTVLEFADCFQKWAIARGHIADGHIRERGDIGIVLGLQDDPTLKLIDDFYHDEAFAHLTPEPDALEVLPRLNALGIEFIAISACDPHADVVERRIRNLEQAFGFKWKEVHCIGLGGSKRDLLSQYPSSAWVEDNFKHAVVGGECGHEAILLDRPYNIGKTSEHITRVTDWFEIEKLYRGSWAGETVACS